MERDATSTPAAGLEGTRQARATASTRGIPRPQAGRAHFTLTRHAPAADLAVHVERHWIVRWDLRGRPPYTQELLPHPCVNLVTEGARAAVFGVPLGRAARQLTGRGEAVGTKFRPGGFAAFSAVPMPAFVGAPPLPLADALGPGGAALAAELAARDGDAEAQLAAVEAFLRARAPAPDPGAALVRAVVADMLVAPAGTRVHELAQAHAVSPRTLQRLFRQHVGVSPKWVLQRLRLHEAAERIARGEVTDWTALALELGYADHAHFVRDFTRLVGRPPGAYAAAC